MSFRLIKLRFRRAFRRRKRQIKDVGGQTDKHIERHLIRRFSRLWQVRRFASLWMLGFFALIGLVSWQAASLSGYYQYLAPTEGGIYREGIVGSFTNANPIYATNTVDKAVSRLVFAGLFKYNPQNELVGDLASGYDVSEDGRTYTVHLKPHLVWQDGERLTAKDVAFTYNLIQNPKVQSPLESSWNDIDVSSKDDRTIVFKLQNPLASFKYSLTVGIVPEHILSKVTPSQMRSADFNTMNPVGAGPFSWGSIEVNGNEPETRQELIALTPFEGYHDGKAKLGGFVVHSYPTDDTAIEALRKRNIDGLAGLNNLPDSLKGIRDIKVHGLPLTAETLVFFKMSNPVLKNTNVRKALVLAANRKKVVDRLPHVANSIERSPLLPSQLGYNDKYQQPEFNLDKARKILQSNGWKLSKDGFRYKKKQKLSFNISILKNPEFSQVAKDLKKQWQAVGADVSVYAQSYSNFQNTLSSHTYDAVLHSISLGVDPDEYVYWDSSQADIRSVSRLNLSEYKNKQVDSALGAGRTRNDPELRAVKYKSFLKAWSRDNPALVLYQPNFLYFTNRPLYNFSDSNQINDAVGRYNNVTNWQIRRTKVTY